MIIIITTTIIIITIITIIHYLYINILCVNVWQMANFLKELWVFLYFAPWKVHLYLHQAASDPPSPEDWSFYPRRQPAGITVSGKLDC